jgi:hypothetical protein
MIYLLIRLYQSSRTVKRLTRLAVAIHHKLARPATRPCPYKTAGSCSEHFAAMARTQGGLAAGLAALSAMAVCGPGRLEDGWCDPKPGDCIGARIGDDCYDELGCSAPCE